MDGQPEEYAVIRKNRLSKRGRHLKTTEDLHANRSSPRTESLVGSAAQWAQTDHEKDRLEVRKFSRNDLCAFAHFPFAENGLLRKRYDRDAVPAQL
jgi:hypothetical protein